MSWEKVDVGTLVILRQGFAINKNTKHYISDEHTNLPLLRIADMKDGTKNVFVKDTIPPKFIARPDDIIYTRTGQVGLVFTNQFGVIHNNCFTVSPIDETILSRSYLYYALQNKEFFEVANSKATGAAQPDLPHGAFNTIPIYLPPIEIQYRIANILSTYDDLIENNRKQIKLLEEAAQRLYKEWFVDLRFPGHERIKTVNNPPEDWTMGTLQQIANFKRGKAITKVQVQEGNIPVVAGGLEPAYYHNVANTKAPVITVSGSGANAGFTRMYYTDVFASDCSFVDASVSDSLPFVYCFLKSNTSKLDTLQKGSAQPHVYAKDINALELYVPSHDLLQRFCDITRPLFAKIGVLERQSIQLSQARDRLLPRLMNQDIKI